MAKRKSSAGKQPLPKHETIPIIIRVDEEVHDSLRKFCYENRTTYSAFLRGLLIEKLRSESYLSKEAKT